MSRPFVHFHIGGMEPQGSMRAFLSLGEILEPAGFSLGTLLGSCRYDDLPSIAGDRPPRTEAGDVSPKDVIITCEGAIPPEDCAKGPLFTWVSHPLHVFRHSCARDWTGGRFRGVLCGSEAVQDFVRDILKVKNAILCRPFVDTALFKPEAKDTVRITSFPGQSPEGRFIRGAFELQNPQHRDVEWVDLDQEPMEDAAAAMARASIHLHADQSGGSGVAPLEAMAAECLVVGFKTPDVEDFAGPMNGLWTRPGELEECAQLLEPAVALAKNGHQSLRTLIEGGRTIALERSRERMAPGIVRAFEDMLRI